MAISYHASRRGFVGFLNYIVGSDGVSRGAVIPAFTQVDSTGAAAGAGTSASPTITSQPAITWTQTVVTLPAGTSTTLVAANANRRALRWMVTGTNPMTVAPGAVTVVAGTGMNYSPGSGTGFQGGSDSFVGNEVSQQAFSAISTGGTTVVVWDGQ